MARYSFAQVSPATSSLSLAPVHAVVDLRCCDIVVGVAQSFTVAGVEPATLVPLRLGGRHCVLVGDPQQLSATVFSQGGALHAQRHHISGHTNLVP